MELLKMTALELGRAIREGKTTPEEAVLSCYEQIEKCEPAVHAFLETDKEKALQRAHEVAQGIREGKYTGPLAGVPIAVKDNICTKGRRTTCASKMLENFVPVYDAEAVKRLKDAGLIIIGKTNMDEFAMGSTTETSAFGITRNPWDTNRVPGGSSGGSCAAVAAGEAFLALGSDTGGSIRQPASFCGVTGMKPTYGSVSRFGLIAYASSLDQIGPVGRDTADCAALLAIISGRDTKDSTCMDMDAVSCQITGQESLEGVKIGIPAEYFAEGISPDVKEVILNAVEKMRTQGAQVEYFDFPLMEYVIPAYYIIACAEASSNLERFDGVKYGYRAADTQKLHEMFKKTRTEGFGEEVKQRILLGTFALSSGYYDAYYLKALKVKAQIKEAFDRAFEKYDLILAPAAPDTAPEVGKSLSDPMKMYLSDVYTAAVNLCGLPAICLPCGKDSGGMPVGVQFIGGCFQDRRVLKAAAAYEKSRGIFPLAFEKEGV